MPKPQGTIGETKFKILAIIYKNDADGNASYGYSIWNTMKKRFFCYLDDASLRNVYRHLKDLEIAGLIEKSKKQIGADSPERQLYLLTENGRQLKGKFNKYFQILCIEMPKSSLEMS
jgi:DNA-binding PadR family transcriptional regulator